MDCEAVSVAKLLRKESRITRLAQRPRVNIEFQDLTYATSSSAAEEKCILKSVSGKFKSGELAAIMGPSGAGKSTLMNVLLGLVTSNVNGFIKINGQPRQMRIFQKLSTYIMQDDILQPHLSVLEAITVAAHLKLGNEIPNDEKQLVIDEVLDTLGLEACRHTRTERLSGGQKKRLSVAMELVNNPPVIFLDEPTTGLDVVSIKQTICLLKVLAQQGRTIICTIHQPSASLFQIFDHVYILADGRCTYQGSPDYVVPFLGGLGLTCPITHNPADFVLETLHASPENVNILSQRIMNGKLSMKVTPGASKIGKLKTLHSASELPPVVTPEIMAERDSHWSTEFATPFRTQLKIILKRMMIQKIRNRMGLWLQFLHHLLMGLSVGILYWGIGNDASHPFTNFKYALFTLVFFMYTYVMTPVLIFPMEVKLLKKEYFNRWYGLKAYFVALTVSTLPPMLIWGTLHTFFSYILSGHPLEIKRYLSFTAFGLLVAAVSEGYGLTIGGLFSIINGSVFAPLGVVPFLVMAVYGMGFGTAMDPIMTFIMNLSYLRHGLVGLSLSLFAQGRPNFHCKEEVCPYQDPGLVLRDLGMRDFSEWHALLILFMFLVLFRLLAFLVLRYRLTLQFSNRIMNYVAKILKHK